MELPPSNRKRGTNILHSVDQQDEAPKPSESNPMPTIDFVLVYNLRDEKFVEYRRAFEKAMLEEGLHLDYETFRGIVFMKIKAPFHRLAKEAERIRLEMSLRGCEIINPTRTCLSRAQTLFMTDDEVDFVSAPFQSEKLRLYEGYENPATFFRSSVRGFLVHHMLINLDISKRLAAIIEMHKAQNKAEDSEESMQVQRAKEDVVNRIGLTNGSQQSFGLAYLLMNGTYMDAFVIHDPSADDPYYARIAHKTLEHHVQPKEPAQDARSELNCTWTKFFKFQPLWKIRNYFGEKIAFYFAWQGTLITLLWIPAILGLAVFCYGISETIRKTPRRICADIVNLTNSNTSANNNSCTAWTSVKYMSEDALDILNKSFDNTYTPFFSLVICLWGALFLEIWKRNLWDVDTFREIEPDRPEFVGTIKQLDPITKRHIWTYPYSQQVQKFIMSGIVVGIAICIVFVSVTSVIFFKVCMKIIFNCSETEDAELDISQVSSHGIPNCLVMTTVLPSIFNGLSIVTFGYLYEKVADRLTRWENHRTQSDYNNSLIIKLFAFQFVNTYSSLFYIAFFRPSSNSIQDGGIFKLGDRYTDTCTRGSCMSLLSFQVLVLMIFKPFPKFFLDIALPFLQRQFYKIKSFLQGYSGSVMEAVAAAGVVLPDHYIQREYHKPATRDFTLTEYSEKILQFGYIMMFAASFPLAPFLALIINLIDLRVDSKRLLWFNRRPVAFMAGDIGMWFPIMRFVTLCGVVSNAFIIAYTSSFCDDFFAQRLKDGSNSGELRLLVVVVFEHVVLICMYLIGMIIPDMPEGIKLAQRRERYEVAKLLEEASMTTLVSRAKQTDAASILDMDKSEDKDKKYEPMIVENEADHGPNRIPSSDGRPRFLNATRRPTVKRRSALVLVSQDLVNRGVSTADACPSDCPYESTTVENSADVNDDQTRSKSADVVVSKSRLATPDNKEAPTENDLSAIPNSIASPPPKKLCQL